MRPAVDELVRALGMASHPEGGFFAEVYRARDMVATPRGERAAATVILFLVTADHRSRLHRLSSDELWLFQGGAALELVSIAPTGELCRRVLGAACAPVGAGSAAVGPGPAGAPVALAPPALVPAGHWQGARLAAGGGAPTAEWSLVSCVVTPGFEYADFELADAATLAAAFPQHGDVIARFT